MLAWNQNGDGLIVQVSTPAWPGAGSARAPRQGDGNTLGCAAGNNVMFSQHFFALRLTPQDVAQVLTGLANASVATDVTIPQLGLDRRAAEHTDRRANARPAVVEHRRFRHDAVERGAADLQAVGAARPAVADGVRGPRRSRGGQRPAVAHRELVGDARHPVDKQRG